MMYQVMRQKRKTATIAVNKDLEVLVKVPYFMSEDQVRQFVNKHEAWIEEQLEKRKSTALKTDWIQTGKKLYLGEYRPVTIQKVNYASKEILVLNEIGFKLITSGDEEMMRKAMEDFFRREAKLLFTKLTKEYARRIDVNYNKITIRKQETRWGSCSSSGNLSYNVKLMCAPLPMIEYVILHEVMHLRHFNHSQVFWQDIEKVMPNYKVRMNYIKQFGQNFMV